MLFPFRTSSIFRNRWVALLWAAGICFAASEIADSLSGVTNKTAPHATQAQKAEHDETNPVDVAPYNAPPHIKPVEEERIVR